LVVEHQHTVGQIVVRCLRAEGYEVLEADNGEQALAVLESDLRIDMVVTDVRMPEMGVLRLAERLTLTGRPKYDGFRGLLYLSGRECHFRSKRRNVLKQFEQLCYWVREELRVKEAILDGEVVALDSEGRQDFRGLLARRGNLHYAAFDVLWLNGKDLRGLPLTRRKRALERVIPATSTVLSRLFAVEGRCRDLFAAAERLDLEGIVAKRQKDPYGLGTLWYKVKNRAFTQLDGRGDLFYPTGRSS
jgi:ATP-dependent DNA ligase